MHQHSNLFAHKLITWYLEHKRDLPWRETNAPYYVWLSEVILQQTRVVQGLPYYLKFIELFPTVHDLAKASEAEVLKAWQGLGYYSRARNLHATAKEISEHRNGDFPDTYQELIKLKGVGDYTASAIGSICFNLPTAVVDGNVYRVLSRVFGIETPINSGQGQKEFKELAQQLIDKEQPGTFNQAIMEFGSQYCVPQNPNCNGCVFRDKCFAFQHQKVDVLPVKIKSKPVRNRYFNYLVFLSEDEKTLLRQRTGRGIWRKLYEFPLVESSTPVDIEELTKLDEFQTLISDLHIDSLVIYNEHPIVHKLSHQHIFARFWIVEIIGATSEFIPLSNIDEYAVPVLIENFITSFFKDGNGSVLES